VGVYLGTSEYGRDYLLGSFNRDGLAAGSSKSYTQTFTVPANVPPGVYYVTVFIDDLRAVSESNEDNNIGSSTPKRVIVQSWQTLLIRRTPGPDNTEVVLEVMKLGDNKVNQFQSFIFSIEIRDPNGQTPRNVGPFIRGGQLYICYDRRRGPDVYLPVDQPESDTEFSWYWTEYKLWSRVTVSEYSEALSRRSNLALAERIGKQLLISSISLGADVILELSTASELLRTVKSVSENIADKIFSILGIDVLPGYKSPDPPDSLMRIILDKNRYVCREVSIITMPRYYVNNKFAGITGWSAYYDLKFPEPGTHQIIIWFYIHYDRVSAPDAFVKLPIEEKIIINITN
jgi:hypothetical protein